MGGGLGARGLVRIRPAQTEDAAAIAAIYAPHVLAGTASFEEEAPPAAEIVQRMIAGAGRYPWLVAADEQVVAYAYASGWSPRPAYRWAVETTVYVADQAQGRGIGRRLYAALLDLVRDQGFTTAIGRIALPNPASVALHQVLGFREAGVLAAIGHKHGRWIDVGIWQCALADAASPPAEPRSLTELG